MLLLENFNFLVFALLAIFTTFIIVFNLSYATLKKYNYTHMSNPTNVNTSVVLLLILLFYITFFETSSSGFFVSTSILSSFYSLVLLTSFLIFCIISKEFCKHKNFIFFEQGVILLFAVLGLFLVVNSCDFLTFYICVEMYSLSFYVLAASRKNSEFCCEAGVKYFVLGALSSGLLLSGISLLFISFGSFAFESIEKVYFISDDTFARLGSLFIFTSFLFKLGSFPFHYWVCDVYEGASVNIMLAFSIFPKLALIGILLNLISFMFVSSQYSLNILLIFSGIGSVVFASIGGLYQKRIKRLLAYSAISQVGFIVLALLGHAPDFVRSVSVYLIIYIVLTLTIFSVLFVSEINNFQQKYIINWASFYVTTPLLAGFFSLLLFSIAGVPPLAGFFSKMYVLLSLFIADLSWASVAVIVFSCISCFYYIRLIKVMAFTTDNKRMLWFFQSTRLVEFFISFGVFFNVLFITNSNFFLVWSTVVAF